MADKTAILLLPRCSVHGAQMEYQIPRTPEQKYVGAMYVCPMCKNSTLIPSKELLNFLDQFKAKKGGRKRGR